MPDQSPDVTAAGPSCATCGSPAIVQWRRRNADDPTHTDAVYACGPHAITMTAAAHVHAATCTAPTVGVVPACDCTPEPLPPPDPAQDPMTTLSTGWIVPTTS